jgi:hypothetical protein
MLQDWINPDFVTSTLAVAGFYVFLYGIIALWHEQLEVKSIVGVETLVFFLALDMAIATGRANLSCFLHPWPIEAPAKQMIFAATAVGTLLALLTSSLFQARAAQLERGHWQAAARSWMWPNASNLRRLVAWSIRAAIATCHTILLIGFASSGAVR